MSAVVGVNEDVLEDEASRPDLKGELS